MRRTDLLPTGKPERFDKRLIKEAERSSKILFFYDTIERPEPSVPTHKKNRRKPPTEAELKDVQDSWNAISAIMRCTRIYHELGLKLSYSVNTETGEVTVDPPGQPNRRGRKLLYRCKVQAMWLQKLKTAKNEEERQVAKEHLYDDLM